MDAQALMTEVKRRVVDVDDPSSRIYFEYGVVVTALDTTYMCAVNAHLSIENGNTVFFLTVYTVIQKQ